MLFAPARGQLNRCLPQIKCEGGGRCDNRTVGVDELNLQTVLATLDTVQYEGLRTLLGTVRLAIQQHAQPLLGAECAVRKAYRNRHCPGVVVDGLGGLRTIDHNGNALC